MLDICGKMCYNIIRKEREELNMKYFVIATHWDNVRKATVKYIAGQFDDYANAAIFKWAYNERYKADAKIVDDFAIINA